MANEVTNNELSRMIKKGFDDTDRRFDEADKRFDDVIDRLHRIETVILKDHQTRIVRLEQAFRAAHPHT